MIENLKVLMMDNYGPFKKGNIYPVAGQGRDWYHLGGSAMYVPQLSTTTNLRALARRGGFRRDDD